ncbi:peptidase S1 [Terricaulis sp.]|uniref:peptidase S1 n=1 Tax=Terricaulis sp. TaxID=2768686 RepID=UPI002AC55D48|nr:peptidase S1 [Terricaulis sp.]MDZ4691936.1 peptidase S1 [Terricaulis sp.]
MSPIARIFAAGAALVAVATAGVAAAQNYGLAPAYGTVNLTAGFTPDPVNVNVLSGGRIDASTRFNGCRGFIAEAPDVRLNYRAGTSLPLILSVNSSADTTLVVNGPDGQWYCDDDGGNTGMNPSLRFGSPQSGQYDIWIGTYGSATNQQAVLSISELYTH